MTTPKKLKPNPAQDLMALASQAASLDERFAAAKQTLKTNPTATGQVPSGPTTAAEVIQLHAADTRGEAGQGIVLKVEGPADLVNLQLGQVIDAPLTLIDLNPLGPRVFYTDEIVAKIRDTFATRQDDAAHGYIQGGRVKLIDGGTRWHAAEETTRRLHVKLEAPPESKAMLYRRARQLNETRTGVTGVDFATSLQKLLTESVYSSQVEIAAKVPGPDGRPMSEETVSKYLRIATLLPESIKLALLRHQETAGFGTAYEMTSLFHGNLDEETQVARKHIAMELIDSMDGTPIPREALARLIKGHLHGPSRRERGDGHKLKFGSQTGAIKLFPKQGKLTLALEGVPPDRLAPIREKLEAALKELLES